MCLASFSVIAVNGQWSYGDSASWMRARDSLIRATTGRPRRWIGAATPIWLRDAGAAVAETRQLQYGVGVDVPMLGWNVGTIASRSPTGLRTPSTYYQASVFAGRSKRVSCWQPSERVHIVTISEALAAIHRTIAEQIGF